MRKSRLSAYKKGKLIEFFVTETSAKISAEIIGINVKSAIYFFHRLRKIIYRETNLERKEIFAGDIELDERLFWRQKKR